MKKLDFHGFTIVITFSQSKRSILLYRFSTPLAQNFKTVFEAKQWVLRYKALQKSKIEINENIEKNSLTWYADKHTIVQEAKTINLEGLLYGY